MEWYYWIHFTITIIFVTCCSSDEFATIGKSQSTVDFAGNPVALEAKGRHDPCVVPRAVPIVETMAALVIADMALRQKRM